MSSAHGGYYLPDPTKWPTITSMGLFLLALGFILDLHHLAPGLWLMIAGSVIIILMLYSWLGRSRERVRQGVTMRRWIRRSGWEWVGLSSPR